MRIKLSICAALVALFSGSAMAMSYTFTCDGSHMVQLQTRDGMVNAFTYDAQEAERVFVRHDTVDGRVVPSVHAVMSVNKKRRKAEGWRFVQNDAATAGVLQSVHYTFDDDGYPVEHVDAKKILCKVPGADFAN